MARVEISLNGRIYPVACEAGQEPRVRELAAFVDTQLREIAAHAAAGIADAHLLAMTSLLLADKVFDLQGEVAGLRNQPPPPREDDEAVAAAVDGLVRRIEDIAARLEKA